MGSTPPPRTSTVAAATPGAAAEHAAGRGFGGHASARVPDRAAAVLRGGAHAGRRRRQARRRRGRARAEREPRSRDGGPPARAVAARRCSCSRSRAAPHARSARASSLRVASFELVAPAPLIRRGLAAVARPAAAWRLTSTLGARARAWSHRRMGALRRTWGEWLTSTVSGDGAASRGGAAAARTDSTVAAFALDVVVR